MAKAVVNAEIRGDASKFNAAVNKAGVSVDKFKQNSLKQLGGTIAAAFTVGAITRFAQEAMSTADEIDNLTKIIGMSAEKVQMLKKTTSDAGISFEKVQAAILKMTQAQTKANAGTEASIEQFRKLGITQKQLRELNTEQLFTLLTASMAENADNAEAMSATYEMLGTRSAGELKEYLIQLGVDGVDATTERLKDMGRIIDNDTIKKLDEMEQKIKNTTETVKNFGMRMLAGAIDGIERFGASLGHLSTGDLKGTIDALGKADYWTETYADEMDEAKKKADALAKAASSAGEKLDEYSDATKKSAESTDGSKQRITELLTEIDHLNDRIKDAQQTEVTFNIQHMTRQDLANWNEFFANFQGEDTDYKVDVQLQHITQQQVDLWERFLNMVRYGNTQTEIKVDLPNLTNHKLKLYEKFFDMVSGAKSYEIKIAKLDPQQLKYYRELVQTMAGAAAFEIKLPDKWPNGVPIDLTGIGALPLSDIAESLRTIAAFKGVICA